MNNAHLPLNTFNPFDIEALVVRKLDKLKELANEGNDENEEEKQEVFSQALPDFE